MNTIDNLNILLPFIQPTSADDFYYLQILQRKKENPELGRNSRVIKNYYLKSADELIKKYDEIRELCRVFNARASLRLNKRSFEKVAFKTLQKIADQMSQRDYGHISHAYDATVGSEHNDKNKKWIIDIDSSEGHIVTLEEVNQLGDVINQLDPITEKSKILAVVPSKSGFHLITSPFNVDQFKKSGYDALDIHKDNPTNLFLIK